MAVKGERKMVIYDKTYRWVVGKSGAVVIYTPDGKKHVAKWFDVTGNTHLPEEDDVHYTVSPSDIRTYIEKNF